MPIGETVVLAVLAGDATIDNKKHKAQFGTKAKMLSREETGLLVGCGAADRQYPAGGGKPVFLKICFDL